MKLDEVLDLGEDLLLEQETVDGVLGTSDDDFTEPMSIEDALHVLGIEQ